MGFFSEKSEVPAAGAATIVGETAVLKGDLTAGGSVRIDGKLEGSVLGAEEAVIGEKGLVVGNISAQNAVMAGELRGNVSAAGMVVLLPSSRVKGDITAGKIKIEEGAVFEGKCLIKGAQAGK